MGIILILLISNLLTRMIHLMKIKSLKQFKLTRWYYFPIASYNTRARVRRCHWNQSSPNLLQRVSITRNLAFNFLLEWIPGPPKTSKS